MSNRLWVLGASDPEMEKIEELLRECGEYIAYASRDGTDRRVTAAEAYASDLTMLPPSEGHLWSGSDDPELYLVECARPAGLDDMTTHVIDHHRPGDPGYGHPPAEFLIASSVGQVIIELISLGLLPVKPDDIWVSRGRVMVSWDDDGSEHTTHLHGVGHAAFVAAADHCLGAAYRGECPGIDPDELMRWRVETRAKHQGRDVGEVLADVERAREILREAPEVVLAERIGHCGGSQCGCGENSYGSGSPHASTRYGTGDCYCDCGDCASAVEAQYAKDMRGQHAHELPEASAREQQCFISHGLPAPDGRVKVVCQSGTPDQIRAFIEVWAPAQGLVDIYGDPARGIAGGYLVASQGGKQ